MPTWYFHRDRCYHNIVFYCCSPSLIWDRVVNALLVPQLVLEKPLLLCVPCLWSSRYYLYYLQWYFQFPTFHVLDLIINYVLQEPSRDCIRAVILCHTRELSAQTYRECKKLAKGKSFRIKLLTKQLLRNADFSKFPCDILISTPLRLRMAIRRKKVDLSRCVMMGISYWFNHKILEISIK